MAAPGAATVGGVRARPALATVLLLAALAAGAAIAAPAEAGAKGRWVVLESGRSGSYLWSVKASTDGDGAASQGARRPCLLVGTKWQLGPFSFRRGRFRRCAEDIGPLTATSMPLIASGEVPTPGSRPKLTAVGMVVAAAVRRVRVTFRDGSANTFRAHRLSARQRRATGLRNVRYAAFSVRGEWCAERVVSKAASGRTLWDSGIDDVPCNAPGGAAATAG